MTCVLVIIDVVFVLVMQFYDTPNEDLLFLKHIYTILQEMKNISIQYNKNVKLLTEDVRYYTTKTLTELTSLSASKFPPIFIALEGKRNNISAQQLNYVAHTCTIHQLQLCCLCVTGFLYLGKVLIGINLKYRSAHPPLSPSSFAVY